MTSVARGATTVISIHALLAESDAMQIEIVKMYALFLSTLSLRRATPKDLRHCTTYLFLSTLSLRRATSDQGASNQRGRQISIHALLAESDKMHALKLANSMLFLSTLSLRRATLHPKYPKGYRWHFYPRSPCGERPERSE